MRVQKAKYTFALLALLLIVLAGCARVMIYKSTWQASPVTIDGKTNDWGPMRFNDANTQIYYNVTNDVDNLYIFIESKDKATVSGITHRGLQVWIDTTGKKNHQVGILCPIPQKNAYAQGSQGGRRGRGNNANYGEQPTSNNQDTAKQNQLHRNFAESVKQMHVSGFKNVPDGALDAANSYGINLGIIWDYSDALVYEVAIPIKSFLKYPLLPSDTTRVIGISFNFSTTPQGGNNGSGPRGSMGGGFGMGFGGMGLMLGVGGGGGNSAPAPEPVTIWTPFHLSLK